MMAMTAKTKGKVKVKGDDKNRSASERLKYLGPNIFVVVFRNKNQIGEK